MTTRGRGDRVATQERGIHVAAQERNDRVAAQEQGDRVAAQERDHHVATWEPRAALCPGSYRVRSGRSAQRAERWVRLHTLHRRDFPGLPRSAGTVRGWTAKLLADHVAAETLETVTLLVSELVANAVVHSDSSLPGGTLTVCLGIGDGVLHVEVIDDGSATSVPTMRATDDDSDSGRGLRWVDLLADAWGTDQDNEAGNAVWFQITSTGRDTPAKQDASAGRTLTTAVPDAGRRDRAE